MAQVIRRIASIDAFRALTMLLMIFVNDLISLRGIPGWLEHAGEMEDRLGLADVVFPAFLFIVGLSIPFAIDRHRRSGRRPIEQSLPEKDYISVSPSSGEIDSRKAKGYSQKSTVFHILSRSFALLVMGVFEVNYEEYNRVDGPINRYWWLLWTTIGFFLIWLDYPREMAAKKKYFLRGSGIFLLALMAFLYKGGEPGDPIWMRLHWYGILGLIGWCYLICALLYLWMGQRRVGILTVIMGLFLAICVIDKAGGLHFFKPLRQFIWIVGSGSLPAITMAGLIAALIYRKGTEAGKAGRSLWILMVLSLIFLVGGFIFRPFWGISKIRATPAWVMICTSISLASFALIAYITDIKGREAWCGPLRPAGTSTLTCYLLPYIHFAISHLLGEAYRLPAVLRTGGIGIVKCLLYAFLIIRITGWMEKRKIRLAI